MAVYSGFTVLHFLQFLSKTCRIVLTSRVENSVDSDQLASENPADLNVHCFRGGHWLSGRVVV